MLLRDGKVDSLRSRTIIESGTHADLRLLFPKLAGPNYWARHGTLPSVNIGRPSQSLIPLHQMIMYAPDAWGRTLKYLCTAPPERLAQAEQGFHTVIASCQWQAG
jgi:hypothetical protein